MPVHGSETEPVVPMASPDKRQTILDTIVALADEIARVAPDCADRARRIVQLAGELEPPPDRASVEDALAAETVDSDLGDAQIRKAARAVVDTIGGGD